MTPDLHNVPDAHYQRARDAGELPADPEPKQTLRDEIDNAVEMVALCDATARDIQCGRLDLAPGLARLLARLDAVHGQLTFVEQIAENQEAYRAT